ncbi:MAG: hypothetical protein HY858_08130 [Candidatus Solibacter usitatus]|nr:hypothetical protein [Candidatus Solibacter usitatus]
MQATRTEAVNAVLDDIAAFEIELDHYYGDLEPQGVIDVLLSGKINTLLAYCQTFGWSELVPHLMNLTPLRGSAVETLSMLQDFVVPEARRLLASSDVEKPQSPTLWFWAFVHPRISSLARPRFEAGFFGDSVEASFKEINDVVKRIVREADGRDLDGASLMTTAFSPQNPIIRLTLLATETDRSIQQGVSV